MTHFRWRKSTHSGDQNQECVEVGFAVSSNPVGIRDTKQDDLPDDVRPQLVVPAASFAALIQALKK